MQKIMFAAMVILDVIVLSQTVQNVTLELRTAFFRDPPHDEMHWTSIQEICREKHSDLVTIYDIDDNKRLSDALGASSGALIGLRKNIDQTCKWSNGEPYNFTKSSVYNDSCYIMNERGEWEPRLCNETNPFICYSDESFSSFEYHLYKERKNWTAAREYCRSQNHSDLISIGNEAENSAVFNVAEGNFSVWIGLRSDGWEWSDKGGSSFMGEKSEGWEENVQGNVHISYSGWALGAETNEKAFICYKEHIHISEAPMIWEEALDYCDGDFDGLLAIDSPKRQRIVEAFLRRQDVEEPVWVGLFQNSLMGFWVWTRGDTVKWSYWKERKKPSLPLSHPCGAVQTEANHFWWTDMNCLTKLRVLCYNKFLK